MGKNPFEVREPSRIEQVSPVDLVVCPSCRAVISLTDIEKPEVRPRERGILSEPEWIKGVYCPNAGCGQRLFDEESWTEHLVARRVGATSARAENEENP